MVAQRGGFVLGLVVGLLVGLTLALGVALYITKAPVPFLDKLPLRTAAQDQAEAERNRNWDPNAPLGVRPPARPAPGLEPASAPVAAEDAASASVPSVPATAPVVSPAASAPLARPDPAAILAGQVPPSPADAFVYFVQVGAFARAEEAEQQRARLALLGHTARISEREQAGRVIYRVRVGPFVERGQADGLQSRFQEQSIEAQIVRVEKP